MKSKYYKGLVGTPSEYQEMLKDFEIMETTLKAISESGQDNPEVTLATEILGYVQQIK